MVTRRRKVLLFGLLAGTLALAAAWFLGGATLFGTASAGMDPTDDDKVALGSQIYLDNCASCHGADLEGQPDWRQRRADGRLPAPPHDAGGHTWHHPPEQLFALTKFGPAALVGGDYKTDMPAYEGTLSDAEIWAVLSYIKSRWPEDIRARHDSMGR